LVQIRNKRIRSRSKGLSLWPLVFFLCLSFLVFQSIRYGSREPYRELLSLSLPFLYGSSPSETTFLPAEALPEVPTLPDIEIHALSPAPIEAEESPRPAAQPLVLIYHTHSTEAYTRTPDSDYEESSPWRTRDPEKNVVAVGKALKSILEERYGITVLHDTTDHEPPKLSTAYSRSLETMLAYKEAYPSLLLFIDLHRDAYGSDPAGAEDYVTLEGKDCARMMFVVGTGEGSTGSAYAELPDFQANFALAERITDALNAFHPDFTRQIRVKTGRYNQHVSNHCLLVEVGHNANTLEQALNSMDYLAAAIVASIDPEALGREETSFDRVISRWAP